MTAGPDRGDFRAVSASSTSAIPGVPSEPVVNYSGLRSEFGAASGGDPLRQDVAQGRVRYERFWALLTTVGGEAVWGVIKRRFGDHTGPRVEDERCESANRQHASSAIQFSIACIVRKLASTATPHSMLRPGCGGA